MAGIAGALAWRLRRHALDPPEATSVADVAERVVALRAWPAGAAALAVAARLSVPALTALEESLSSGEVIRSYAFRGGSYVFTPAVAADLLTARTATRIWESPRWQRQGGLEIDDWQPLRDAMRAMLADGPMTREQISAALEQIPALRELARPALGSGADSLYKPLHWWGDICFGPTRDGSSTFRLLDAGGDEFASPDIDGAGTRCVRRYLHAYAPATRANLHYWITEGLGVPARLVDAWLARLDGEVAGVTIDGEASLVLAADLDGLAAAHATDTVHLLPAFDPWVFGPGTADSRITPPPHRAVASKGSNLLLFRGRIAGTWSVGKGAVVVRSFSPQRLPADRVEHAARRLAAIRGEELDVVIDRAD